MCKAPSKTAASLMAAILPTLVSLLTFFGVINTPQGQAAIAAFEAAQKAVAAWVPGTAAEDVIQVIGAFTQVFAALPLPPAAELLANVISAGIVAVIGVLSANAPAPTVTAAAHDEVQAAHIAEVVADTSSKVEDLMPGFKRSIFTSPAHQYTSAWNKTVDETVDESGAEYAGLKV